MDDNSLLTGAQRFLGQTSANVQPKTDDAPAFQPGSDSFTDEERVRRRAGVQAATQVLFQTDLSKLDDDAVGGLYRASAKALFGIEDPDGTVAFGRKNAGDARHNVELLRRFCKGDYSVIRDPEYDSWRAMDEEQKFRHALENESKSAKVKGNLEGKRGASLLEMLALSGTSGAPDNQLPQETREDIQRRMDYDRLTPEEQEVYRRDVIGRYDRKIAKEQVLATYLAAKEGMSDRAAEMLASSYNRGEVDVDAVEALSDEDKDRFYTALSIMRGDQKKGHLLGIPTDFTDDTAVNRGQLALYGLQQSVLGLVSDTWEVGSSAAKWAYAKTLMDDQARKDYFRRWNAEARAKTALEQGLPEADTWMGEMVQALGENSHWFIPYAGIAKGGKMAREAAGTAGALLKSARAAKGAADLEKGMVNLWARQFASIERFTDALRDGAKAAGAVKGKMAGGAAMWTAGEASAFSAFANEYISNCDAAGVSREESVPMSAIVGLVNAKIESLYVPGLESALTPAQVKNLMMASGLRALKSDGAAGFRRWLGNYVEKGLVEGAKVTLTEGAVEEPLQQFVQEWGKEIAQSAEELKKSGRGELGLALGKFVYDNFAADGGFERFAQRNLETYVETAVDMIPSSVGFGLTTNGRQKLAQHRRNRAVRKMNMARWRADVAAAEAAGREAPPAPLMLGLDEQNRMTFNPNGVDYDEGVVDLVQREIDTRRLVGDYWEGKGQTEAGPGEDNRYVQAMTEARRIWRSGQGDKVNRIAEAAGVDHTTAEVIAQYLQTEQETAAFSPRVREYVGLAVSAADFSEDTIRNILPGYVEGSFVADEANGIYAAKVKIADGSERTIAYRFGDLSAELSSEVEKHERVDSEFGRSYDAQQRRGADNGSRPWASLSDAERHNIAMRLALGTYGMTDGSGAVLEMTDADGNKVTVNADEVIRLSNGKLADIGYMPLATMGTARHETFHALWRFAAASYTEEQLQETAKALGLDVTSEDWKVDLDEEMAHQMEQYASGHYVSHVAESRIEKLLDTGAGKFIDMLSGMGLGDEVKNAKTGRSFVLKDFYDSVLRGQIGSGELGVNHTATAAAKPTAQNKSTKTSSIPVDVTEDERKKESQAQTQAQASEEPVQPQEKSPSTEQSKSYTLDNPADATVPDAKFYRVQAGDGVSIVGELVVSDVEDLKTSYKGTLEDGSLQNRGETMEGRSLVEKIAGNPDPLQVGTVQPRANNGFIWATPSGNVFIGNTRETGITRAYERGNAENVRAYMINEATKRGLEIPDGVRNPIVHFVLRSVESADGSATIQDVVRLTNESVNRGMNVYEQAKNDADVMLKANLVPGIELRPDGSIDTEKSAAAIGTFRRLTNAQGMINEDTGLLTEEGQTRLSNAVLAAFIGSEDSALMQKVIRDSGRLDMENEKRALMRSASDLMALGAQKPQYDLRWPIAEALYYFTEWREADESRRADSGKTRHDWYERTKEGARKRGISWADHMAQLDMFRTPSPEARIIGDLLAASRDLRSFEADDRETEAGKRRAQDLISRYLADYADNARKANTETEDMFGEPPATREDILKEQRVKDAARRFSYAADPEHGEEYRQIYDRNHNADGSAKYGWLKEPNGKSTNLTPVQWASVRTKSYTGWFGDWLKKSELEHAVDFALNGKPVSVLTGNEFEKTGKKDLVDRVAKFFDGLGGSVENPELGTVLIDRESVKSSLAHGIGRKKAAAFAAVPDVIRNGAIFNRQVNWKNRGTNTFVLAAPIKIGKENFVCEAIVVEGSGEKERKFYLHEVNLQSLISNTIKTPTGGVGIGDPARPVRSILAKDYKEFNPDSVSKVVDENGAPLVVYRGAPFDPLAQEPGKGVIMPGAYFTPDAEYAKRYKKDGEVRAYFLNLKNPLDVRNPKHAADLAKLFPAGYKFATGTTGALDWGEMSSFDIEDLKAMGYDGIILDEGADNQPDGTVKPRGISYVPFDGAAQVKSATDNNGAWSENPDVRFSWAMPGETADKAPHRRLAMGKMDDAARRKDLLAVHNLHMSSIRAISEMGGFAMPSIAVVKDTYGHNEFGDVTVLFDKATIDPRKNRQNALYSHDAWTPTFPSIYNKIDEKGIMKANERILSTLPEDLIRAIGNQGYKLNYVDGVHDAFDTAEDAAAAYADNLLMKAAYLVSAGEKVEPVMRKKSYLRRVGMKTRLMGENGLKAIHERLGSQLMDVLNGPGEESWGRYEKLVPEVENIIRDAIWERDFKNDPDVVKNGFTKEDCVGKYFVDSHLEWVDMTDIAEAVSSYDYDVRNGTSGDEIVDEYGTQNAIRKRVDETDAAYRAWINAQYDKPIIGRGVYNGKERYTSSGNRRSWDMLHDPATLENIVKAMKKTQRENGSGVLGRNPFGVAVRKFRSIGDLVDNEDLLKPLTREEESAVKDELIERLSSLVTEYQHSHKNPDSNKYIEHDRAADMMFDAWEGAHGSFNGMKSLLNSWGYSADDDLTQRIKQVFDDMSVMPTNYFEAKPMREVYFGEMKAWIVPDTISAEDRKILNGNGQRVFVYKTGDEADRLRAVNEAADHTGVRFSYVSEETRNAFANDPSTTRWKIFAEPLAVREMTSEPVRNLPPVTSDIDNKSVEKAIQKTFADFGQVENIRDGYRVVFNRADAGKMMMQSGVDMRTFAPQMKHLFESSVHAFDNPQERIPGHKFRKNVTLFRHYINKVMMNDGKEFYIRFTIREETGGRKGVHLATVSEVEIYDYKNAGMSASANKSEGARVFVDKIIARYLDKGNCINGTIYEQRPTEAGKEENIENRQNGSRKFSYAFPRLDTLSDDQLVAAAVASQMALGKSDKVSDRSVKITTVQKLIKGIHPEWSTHQVGVEALRVATEAQKLARKIREDLDRGVSDSLVLQHLPDAVREQFGQEMTHQARQGARLGAYHQRAMSAVEDKQAKVIEEAVKVQSGIETKLLENAYGVDLSQTLMNLVANPFLKKDANGLYVPAGGGEQAAQDQGEIVQADAPEKEVSDKARRAVDEVVAKSAEARAAEKANEKESERMRGRDQENASGSGGEEDASLEGADIVDIATRKQGLNLEDPRQLAHFVAELARRYWVDTHGLAKDANAWADSVAVQFLRKTAANVYGKLAQEIAYSQARDVASRSIDGFGNIPTVQGLISEMTYVGQVINARKIRETQQQLCERLDLFLREKMGAQGRFKPDNEELHRKVSAEIELRARYMRHAMWLTPDAASEEAKELQRQMDAATVDFKGEGHDAEQARVMVENLRKLNVLREFGSLRYKPVAQIEAAIQYWEDLERGSGDDIARENLDREIRTKKAAAMLAKAFHNPSRKYAREGKGVGDMLSDYLSSHMGFMNLLRDMTRYASKEDAAEAETIFRYLELEIQKAGTKTEVEKRRHAEALASAVNSIYGRDFAKVLKEFAKKDDRFAPFMGAVDGHPVPPTKGRAIQLMVSLLQEGRKIEVEDTEHPGEFIIQWEGGYHDNIVKHGREKQAAEIAKLLTPADMNLVKWLGQWYEANRQELSQVCDSLFGIGVYAETSNYFPVKMLLEKQGLEKGEAVGWSIFPRALTPRVRNERDFDTSADVLQMFMSRMEEAAQWKAHAQLGLELRGIFGRSELQAAITSNHGNKVNQTVLGFVTDTLAGKGTVDRGDNGATYYTDMVRGWAALGALGANFGVMFKQTTSIPAFGFEIGLRKTASHIATAFTPEGMAAMRKIFDSDQRKVRWNTGNTEAVKNALANSGNGPFMRLWKASMFTNRLGDCVPALVVGQGIYREALENGMSEEDAMAYTWMLVERTQQSGRIENQAQFQRRSKFGRAIYQFLSTQQQYLQYEVRALRGVVAKPGDLGKWGDLARAAVLNHFILSSAYFWMGALFKRALGQEPPEDELKDWVVSMLIGPYGALYGMGFTCTGALNEWIKGPQYGGSTSSLPSLSFVGNVIVRDPAAIVKSAFDETKTWDDVLEKMGRFGADANALFRDLRKLKKNYWDD